MALDNLEQLIEAVLFTAGEPVSIERLQQLIDDQQDISGLSLIQAIDASPLEEVTEPSAISKISLKEFARIAPNYRPTLSGSRD